MIEVLKSVAVLCCLLCIGKAADGQITRTASVNIIPYPASLEYATGTFTMNSQTTLQIEKGTIGFHNEVAFLQKMVRGYLGAGALNHATNAAANTILLKIDNTLTNAEGYVLNINQGRIDISAKDAGGMFYAIETLRQLMPADVEKAGAHGSSINLPALKIQDHPAFMWRGMMLDVSRHFFSVTYLRKFIDLMALYKLNKLHLHLTDDQGWRIEIKKYPRLTEESAWRTFDHNDSALMKLEKETGNTDFALDAEHIVQRTGKTMYGGFYTQSEMKDVIQYAASKHIEIIPEIDMPGHMKAATQVYPDLTCDGASGSTIGFSHPICPCNDNVINFAKDIYTELAALFPSKYIHIGGDEVDKTDWGKSAGCKAFMAKNNLKDFDELQSFFNREMGNFFKTKGKTLIGWDEVVEGGIDSSVMVMFWRTWVNSAPMRAAGNNNMVIMTPDGPFYFDAFPDKSSLRTVYDYNPLSPAYRLTKNDENKIIGVQGNLWTEMIPSEKRVDYMIMPRMSALAELGWTNQKMYDSYLSRLDAQYERLDNLKISYRLPDLADVADSHVFLDTTSFFIPSPSARLKIRYTTDGSYPTSASPVLSKPITINHSLNLKMAAFTSANRRGDIYSLSFDHQSYAEPVAETDMQAGLACSVYKGSFPRTTAIKAAADSTLLLNQVMIPTSMPDNGFGLKFRGYIDVPETGIYSFFLNSNDGSILRIAGRLVVDNDGLHADQEKSGQVALKQGLHPFELNFIDGGGGYKLDLRYSNGNGNALSVPASWFKSHK